ncbi:MAG: SDR family NAD(P)-dependent oxidoreductase [Candidatus Xenobia bacterium]
MDLGIEGRLTLVTGASRGIGRSIAIELSQHGARVVLVARSGQGLNKTREEMLNPERHLVVAADLMTTEGIRQVTTEVEEQGNLDILIHNLGGSLGITDPFASVEEWARVWHYNVGIGHELNRIFVPHMIERRWGRIVHLSTLSTVTHKGNAAYVSSKCALDGYIKRMSREIARHGVIMSAVAPGAVVLEGRYFARLQKEDPAALETYYDQNLPIRRLGTGQDVAQVVVFLCSAQAAYMVGSIVAVDGGHT